MSTTNKPIKTSSRPARTLAILALVLVAMASLVFIQGATSVRLGLDLRGGTSVTLQPRIAPGDEGKVTSEAIDQAVSIIRQRVNSLGVAESEVAAQGSGTNRQIVISVPGDTGRRVVELVGQTAELRFRQVLASASGIPAAADAAATPAAGVVPRSMQSLQHLIAQSQRIFRALVLMHRLILWLHVIALVELSTSLLPQKFSVVRFQRHLQVWILKQVATGL